MSKRHLHIGIEDPGRGFQRFTKAWECAEQGQLLAESTSSLPQWGSIVVQGHFILWHHSIELLRL